MKYCSNCGKPVIERIPEGDNRLRFVCDHCDTIHYQNPRIIAGCIPVYDNKILLCKRAIEPRYGLWTLPAGFMENGETTREAALRETWEEALAEVEIESIYTIFNLPHINQVYMLFRGNLKKIDFGPGEESLETALFGKYEIPWEQLAFPAVHHTLKFFFDDQPSGTFPVRVRDLEPHTHFKRQP